MRTGSDATHMRRARAKAAKQHRQDLLTAATTSRRDRYLRSAARLLHRETYGPYAPVPASIAKRKPHGPPASRTKSSPPTSEAPVCPPPPASQEWDAMVPPAPFWPPPLPGVYDVPPVTCPRPDPAIDVAIQSGKIDVLLATVRALAHATT